jgi:hypothetical protein
VYLAKFLARSQRVLDYVFIAGWWLQAIYYAVGFVILHFMWQVSYVVKYLMADISILELVSLHMGAALFVASLIGKALRCDSYKKLHTFGALCGVAIVAGMFLVSFRSVLSAQADFSGAWLLFCLLLLLMFFMLMLLNVSFCSGAGIGKKYDPAQTNAHLVSPVFNRMFGAGYVATAAVAAGILLCLHVTDAGRNVVFYKMASAIERVAAQTDFELVRKSFNQDGRIGDLPSVGSKDRVSLFPSFDGHASIFYEYFYIFPQRLEDGTVVYKAITLSPGVSVDRRIAKISEVSFDFAACEGFSVYWEQFLQAGEEPYGFMLRGVMEGPYYEPIYFYEQYFAFFKQSTDAGDVIVLFKVYSKNMRRKFVDISPFHCR